MPDPPTGFQKIEPIRNAAPQRLVQRSFSVVRIIVWAAAAITICAATTLAAAGTYRVWGVGTTPCGDWTYFHEHSGKNDPLHSRMDLIESAWVDGFVSAYDDYGMEYAGNVADGSDVTSIEAWVSTYCQAHPRDSIAVAAGELITELERRRHGR